MCGICGFVSSKKTGMDALLKMNNTLAHRGPDDHGEEIYPMSANFYIGLAQRRLSIIDLSDQGHQPMHSYDKRITVVFNGEIYNFRELKEELKGYPFKSRSDTEVIIASYLKWDIDFVNRINGMYVIALFDRKTDTLYLIRDRIGKKPLYYYIKDQNNIAFGSELKAILACPFFESKLNNEIIGRFLYKQYIAAPDTIYANTFKLEQGSYLKIQHKGITKIKYWDIAKKYIELHNKKLMAYEEAKQEFEMLMRKAVSRRLVADVPIGAFLSGGYDSSLVCALAQSGLGKPLKTFCIGFNEEQLNEAKYAKKVAEYLGTEHKELYIEEKEMLGVLESIPTYFDEPFADSSQIPTMLVSELAKKDVSVVLSGDGGDELFGGYNIYTVLQRSQILLKDGRIDSAADEQDWIKKPIEYRIIMDKRVGNKAKTQAGASTYADCIDMLLLKTHDNYFYEFEDKYCEDRFDITRMLLDMDTYLPDDILTKVDRSSMKYALECRCPLLDNEIIEFSLGLPWNYKDDNGNQKRIIKDVAYKYIPKDLLDRPKAGFSVPLDKWLRGSLKEKLKGWADKDFLRKQNIFNPDTTAKFIADYIRNGDIGKWSGANYSKIVWPFFVFQQWFEYYFRGV